MITKKKVGYCILYKKYLRILKQRFQGLLTRTNARSFPPCLVSESEQCCSPQAGSQELCHCSSTGHLQSSQPDSQSFHKRLCMSPDPVLYLVRVYSGKCMEGKLRPTGCCALTLCLTHTVT